MDTGTSSNEERARGAKTPVFNVSINRSMDSFWNRYRRWGVIHRTSVAPTTYLGQWFLNPAPFAFLGMVALPNRWTALGFAVTLLAKVIYDIGTMSKFRGEFVGWKAIACIPVKDGLLFLTHAMGFYDRTVMWRGNKLRVMQGSKLVMPGHLQPMPELTEHSGPVPVEPQPEEVYVRSA
jgi:ceramide glucosyltransferase